MPKLIPKLMLSFRDEEFRFGPASEPDEPASVTFNTDPDVTFNTDPDVTFGVE